MCGIQLDGVTLSERGSGADCRPCESARASVAVMPLRDKQVQVRALDVTGLKAATLIKREDGSLDVADLLGGLEHQSAPARCTCAAGRALRDRCGRRTPSPTPSAPGATGQVGGAASVDRR